MATLPTVTLKQIAADLADKNGLSKKDTTAVLEGFVASCAKNIKQGKRVRIPGFGILQVKQTKARMGRNPATGEAIKIPAKKKVAFRVAKDLKESVLK
jgi:DNA-binding protein HU-beta